MYITLRKGHIFELCNTMIYLLDLLRIAFVKNKKFRAPPKQIGCEINGITQSRHCWLKV